MSNYTLSTDFTAKDSLISGNPSKLVKGSEISTEFNAVATAISSKVDKTSTTGSAQLPTGTQAQRDVSPLVGYTRYNTTTRQVEVYTLSGWLNVDGATGGPGNSLLFENDITMSVDYTITTGKNAMSAGPITVNPGITLTVPSGSTYTIV